MAPVQQRFWHGLRSYMNYIILEPRGQKQSGGARDDPSPRPGRCRSQNGQIITWLGVYSAATPGVKLNDNATVRLDMDNEVQPDALLRLEPAAGGHFWISEDDYVESAPELIVEIAYSSAAYDLHDKKEVYLRNGVQEYLVWQVHENRLDWFRWHEGEYVPLFG